MKKLFQRYTPDPSDLRKQPLFRYLGNSILHPALWHISRRSAAGGVATGLFCGLIPGPLQMLGSAVLCMLGKFNLPIALVTTFYTNPFTILPLYLVGYKIGSFVLGNGTHFVKPPEKGDLAFLEWLQMLGHWMMGLGTPLALGLLILASVLATAGYACVYFGWHWHVVHKLRQRRENRATN